MTPSGLTMASYVAITAIVVTIFGLGLTIFFKLVSSLIVTQIDSINKTLSMEIGAMTTRCATTSGFIQEQQKTANSTLHASLVTETKTRVRTFEDLRRDFKKHGHKGLDADAAKLTI